MIGLDGFILIAFIAGFPANEIVIPVLLMAYMSAGTLTDFESIDSLRQILLSNGWTPNGPKCDVVFSSSLALLHDLMDNKKRNRQFEMDICGFHNSYRACILGLFCNCRSV